VSNAGTPGAPEVVLAYAFDAAGNVLSMADSIAGAAAGLNTYSYDALNRMASVSQSGVGVSEKRVEFAYNPLGQFSEIRRFGDLAGRAITNVTRREFIRAQDLVHLEMNTPAEKIEEALKIIRELVTNHEGHDHRHPPAVHVLEFGEWAVNIRFMYWYRPANSSKQLEFNQKLMLQIMDRLQKANIRLASQGTPQNR
jgi:hypothetical protein